MASLFTAIVLRDVPKLSAQIDLFKYPLKGGFRGFSLVPPGVHYVSVQAEATHPGFWCYLHPDEVVVKVFDYTLQQFVDDNSESVATYQQLAINGSMGTALFPYPQEQWEKWRKLTQYINSSDFPPQLHQEIVSEPPVNLPIAELSDWMEKHHKSRFELALFDTHKGDKEAFLGELQFSFVRWLVTSENDGDAEAFNRWQHLLLSIYNAGERIISQNSNCFVAVIDTLIAQFECLPDSMFEPNSFVNHDASYLVEDMLDTDIEELGAKGREFAAYLEKRRTNG
ncbi:AAR2 splicing factor family protein [Trichocoleus sp. Lan]|uniref:AAR2 pre-mRNA splicing protein n=1 Tax=Cyanophyceae TaxID=3028117 RepID=UPI001687A32E|nr:AAR2 pre-mRNA splicing protein [Coleofasciculus sp. FACHB-542]MBD2086303.1 AAR2 pre-mRNA splicing protein [Coleofasciculus sp. FACHB-542]